MRSKHYHSLKHPFLRMSMNKINLYNIARARPVNTRSATFFQQKFRSKQATRAYHGEMVREKQWQLMYKATPRSVTQMYPETLATFDGSEMAEGRGSGKEQFHSEGYSDKTGPFANTSHQLPFAHLTYAPLERRLDTAIFRALFASSVRQARQFVIHGHVKVNGKKMNFPGYLLNPGDLFQVEVDRVLTATGAPKNAEERVETRRLRKKIKARREAAAEKAESATEVEAEAEAEAGEEKVATPAASENTEVERRKAHKKSLGVILESAKAILNDRNKAPSAKQKKRLRAFQHDVKNALGRWKRTDINDLDAQIDELTSKLNTAKIGGGAQAQAEAQSTAEAEAEKKQAKTPVNIEETLTREERAMLKQAIEEMEENPVDPRKSYATPWRPRDYMPAFAFIPSYLEVNQNICSAVYIRHPVVRDQKAEIPSPFHIDTAQLAHTWYLKRR